jgi:CheY-like chemotaxis protein
MPLILLVERDPHVRALAAQFLAEAGYRVEIAADGQEALDRVRIVDPDLVICEILVPKLDGLALCRQLKANPGTSHISILVFSILAASARAKEAGADEFMMKPLAQHRLIAMVQGLLEKRSTVTRRHVQERS